VRRRLSRRIPTIHTGIGDRSFTLTSWWRDDSLKALGVRLEGWYLQAHPQSISGTVPTRVLTSKGAVCPHRRQRGGPFGSPDALGAIRSMLEQFKGSWQLAVAVVIPAKD